MLNMLASDSKAKVSDAWRVGVRLFRIFGRRSSSIVAQMGKSLKLVFEDAKGKWTRVG